MKPFATPRRLVIAVMSFTGVVLAFEHEIFDWAREADDTEARVTGVTVSADPLDAVSVNLSRDAGVYYVNPYTGEVRPVVSTRTHDFMHLMEEWHRFLSLSGDRRPLGKAITGACNLAFLFLALSGLYHATASTQAVIHPFTGEFLQREGYADQTAGRQTRSWLRYLHTGQAFGRFGQLVAGLACAGGLVLVYTCFALSWRRFFTRKV